MAKNLSVGENNVVFDIGTGFGIFGILAARKARKVVATNVNHNAIRCTRLNAKISNVGDKMDIRLCNLSQPIHQDECFSLILFNAPYLPSSPDEEKTWIGQAWAGGPKWRQLIDRFISEEAPHLTREGKILFSAILVVWC